MPELRADDNFSDSPLMHSDDRAMLETLASEVYEFVKMKDALRRRLGMLEPTEPLFGGGKAGAMSVFTGTVTNVTGTSANTAYDVQADHDPSITISGAVPLLREFGSANIVPGGKGSECLLGSFLVAPTGPVIGGEGGASPPQFVLKLIAVLPEKMNPAACQGSSGIASAPNLGVAAGNSAMEQSGYSLKETLDYALSKGSSAAGSDTQVQFNNAGVLGGHADFTFDPGSQQVRAKYFGRPGDTIVIGDGVGEGNNTQFVVDDALMLTTSNVKHEAASDISILDSAKGLVLKDTQATPHYWRVKVTTLGVLTTTDLGTSPP